MFRFFKYFNNTIGGVVPRDTSLFKSNWPLFPVLSRHFRKSCIRFKMESQPWREASTVIITSRLPIQDRVAAKDKNLSTLMSSMTRNYDNKPTSPDYKVLLVKRSSKSSFYANAFVFPGGLVEVADYSPLWWPVFEKLGFTRNDLLKFCSQFHGHRPPMVTNPITLKSKPNEDYLPPDIALRIAAMRETFEETGILLLTNPSLETTQEATTHTILSQDIDIGMWQKKVHSDPYAFLELCLQSHMCPDIWLLHEWSNWLTPKSEGKRRYDTMFYLCCLPRQPDVLLDKTEVTVTNWCSPKEILEDHMKKVLFLAPPQVYELCRMISIQSYHHLKDFATKRGKLGCERWLPIISQAVDGLFSYLPGDDLYPKEPGFEGTHEYENFDYTLEELRLKSKNLHRFEFNGPQCTMYCNIMPSCGHLKPLTYTPAESVIQSSL